jgi:hypothetical protein
MVATPDSIATPICHIFILSRVRTICHQVWMETKVIPLPKSGKAAFTCSNTRPISLLPALSKLGEKMCLTKYNAISLVTNEQ